MASDAHRQLLDFLQALPDDGTLLVVTGAGISLASGIPTFRGTDRDAIWKKDVTELGTFAFFEADPVGSWRWYLSRFSCVFGARPNPAHVALVGIERWHGTGGGTFLLATQNVDTLHEQAGSKQMVKVHGSADRVRCTDPACANAAPRGSLPRPDEAIARFLADPRRETVPRCPACGSLLRQHVLWFDESYGEHVDYQFRRVLHTAGAADRVLFVGTSFSVGVTDAVLGGAEYAQAPVASIDPGEQPVPVGVEAIRAKAEEVLPAVLARLKPRR